MLIMRYLNSVLQVILPLTVCGTSLLVILIRLAHRYILTQKGVAYKVLPNNDSEDEVPSASQENESDTMFTRVLRYGSRGGGRIRE